MEIPEIEYIYNLRRFGMKLDLSVMKSFANLRNNPQENFKSVHIAGTNGKGSVASAVYSILRRNYSAGLYTSPHLVRYSERIVVNGNEIEEDYIVKFVKEIKPLLNKLAHENRNPTFFEVTTMLAFEYFSFKNVDFGVLEVGLGGRLDATNIVKPKVTAIVTVDLDHTQILGNTIEKIAWEKAGIIKKHVPVVVGESKREATEVIKNVARKRDSEYHNIWEEMEIENVEIGLRELKFTVNSPLREYRIRAPLTGRHQLTNLLVAIRLAEILGEKYSISKTDIEKGIESMRWRDRFQVKKMNPLLIFDSAHNPSAARAVVSTIEDLKIERPTFLFSMLSNKNIDEFLKILSSVSSRIIATQIGYERRRMELQEIISHANRYFKEVISFKNPCDALDYALQNEHRIVATGSIYLLGELEKCLLS